MKIKFFKPKKLNSFGVTHLLVPLLAIVAIGGIGSYLLTASHADSLTPLVQCKSGKTSSGRAIYTCSFSTPTPVVKASVSNGSGGTFYKFSDNYIYCQASGSEVYRKIGSTTYRNHYWGFTLSDQNHYGWVNAVYAHTGNNDSGFGYVSGGKWVSVPTCPSSDGKPGSTGSGSNPTPTPTPAPPSHPTPAPLPTPTSYATCKADGGKIVSASESATAMISSCTYGGKIWSTTIYTPNNYTSCKAAGGTLTEQRVSTDSFTYICSYSNGRWTSSTP